MATKTDAKSLELTLKREMDDQKEEEIDLETANEKKESQSPIFAFDGDDIWIGLMLFVLVCIAAVIIYLFRDYNRMRHMIVLFCGSIPSSLMVVALNGNALSARKRSLIIIPSYCVALCVVVVIAVFGFVEFSGFITVTAAIFSYIIILVIFFYQKAQEKGIKESGKYVLKMKGLILPMLMHFADIATDIGTTIEYYDRSTIDNGENDIPYDSIFQTSIGIMIFYRIAGAFIVWEFSRSFKRAALQFIEVYIFEVLWTEWELGFTEAGRVHSMLNLIESIFESGPQAIISTYILVADQNKKGSVVIWLSTLFSIISIAHKTKTQDDLYFSTSMKAKEADWKIKKPQCGDGRCAFCHWRWFFRVCWRIIDITGFILLCTAIWLHLGGKTLFIWLAILFTGFLVLCGFSFFRWGALNMHYMNGLLACAVIGWNYDDQASDSVGSSFACPLSIATVMRYVVHFIFVLVILGPSIPEFCIAENTDEEDASSIPDEKGAAPCWGSRRPSTPDELSLVVLVMISCTGIGYFIMTMRECEQHCCCRCGKNWVDSSVDSALNISSCKDKRQIYKLGEEGVDIRSGLKQGKTWGKYPRPMELIEIADELKIDLKGNQTKYFEMIGGNASLDPNVDEMEIREVVQRLKEVEDIGNNNPYIILEAVKTHPNAKWIKVLVEEGAYVRYDAIENLYIFQTEIKNKSNGRDEIIEFLRNLRRSELEKRLLTKSEDVNGDETEEKKAKKSKDKKESSDDDDEDEEDASPNASD
eukprot:243637_1